MLCWITLMLIYSLFNFYSLFKTHSYVLFFIFIYKNVVNICMINDLYYPPTTHPHIIGMQFFYYSTRGSSASPVDITAIRASLIHMHHTDLGIVAPGSHKLCLQFVCSPCGLRMRCRSSTDSFWFHTGHACSLLLIHGFTTNTTFIHYFELKSKQCYWKCFFSIVIFFYQSTVSQSFIDVSKCKKYKQWIIQCVYF